MCGEHGAVGRHGGAHTKWGEYQSVFVTCMGTRSYRGVTSECPAEGATLAGHLLKMYKLKGLLFS